VSDSALNFAVVMASPATDTISSAAMSRSCAALSELVETGILLLSHPATLRNMRPDGALAPGCEAACSDLWHLASPSLISFPARFDMTAASLSAGNAEYSIRGRDRRIRIRGLPELTTIPTSKKLIFNEKINTRFRDTLLGPLLAGSVLQGAAAPGG